MQYTEKQLKTLSDRWKEHSEEIRCLIPILRESATWHRSDTYKQLMVKLGPLSDGIDEHQKDLRGLTLFEADLSKANLAGADFAGTDFEGANLEGSNLEGANLSKSYLWNANLTFSKLNSANLSEAKLESADLSEAELWGANLSHSNMDGANLYKANLWKADLTGAYLGGVNFSGAYLRETDLSRAFLGSSNLEGTDLVQANLSGVDVGLGVRWNEKNRFWPRLKKFDLKGENLEPKDRKTTFSGNDIRDTNWSGAALLKRFVEDEIFLAEYIAKEGFQDRLISWLWKWTSNYGRDLSRWMAIAITMAILFGIVLFALEDHFSIGDHIKAPKLATMLYTSVVIFTTLGFGDVTPKTLLAEIVVAVEVIIGYIMLGGLISIFSNRFARRSSNLFNSIASLEILTQPD